MASIKLKGDTSGEITISSPAVAGTTTLTLPKTTSTLATENALGVRNLIINGDMKIAQRGTSVTGSTTGGGYSTVDRFNFLVSSAGTWDISQSTDVPSGQGFSNSFKLDCTTADASLASGDYILFSQRIEGQNLQHLKKGTSNAEKLTYSFWVKSAKTGTYIVEFRDQDNVRIICKSYTIDAANTWEKKTLTIDGDTTGAFDNDNANSFEIIMWLAAGSLFQSGTLPSTWEASDNADRAVGQVNLADSTSNDWYITAIQLEVGDTATPFEHRPYDMELARCQRYFIKKYKGSYPYTVGFIAYASNAGVCAEGFPVQMRTTPTVTISTSAGNGYVNATASNSNISATPQQSWWNANGILGIQPSSGLTAGQGYGFDYEATAEL